MCSAAHGQFEARGKWNMNCWRARCFFLRSWWRVDSVWRRVNMCKSWTEHQSGLLFSVNVGRSNSFTLQSLLVVLISQSYKSPVYEALSWHGVSYGLHVPHERLCLSSQLSSSLSAALILCAGTGPGTPGAPFLILAPVWVCVCVCVMCSCVYMHA